MVGVEKAIVKIQAKFRQLLAVKKLEKQNLKEKARLARREQMKHGVSHEEMALCEFKTLLRAKGLTPEAFYRCCDPEYNRTISIDTFKKMISNFNIYLSRSQISRLVLILDEDMEGHITLDEFYNALEAYGCSAEQHYATDGSEYYCGFEHRAMFKLLDILSARKISFQELFRMCDVSNDGVVNIKELEQVLSGLSAEFKQKDV